MTLVAGCSDSTDDAAASEATTVTQVDGQTLAPEEFGELAADDGVIVLDVRTAEEYASGHLPDAINIDVTAADFESKLAELDPGTTYAVYCKTGRRSQTALATMSDAGFTSVADLAGGISAWIAAGKTVVTD